MVNSEQKIFYGWIIVWSFLVISTVVYGLTQSFGVFFKLLGTSFGLTRAETSAIVSTQSIFGTIIAFVAGRTLDKFGPRIIVLIIGASMGLALILTSQTNASWQLFITYSLFSCVVGANYTTMAGTVSRWFHRKRGLALGIAATGMGFGAIFIVPLSAWLISVSGWRTAYMILGATAWIFVIPLSRLLRKNPGDLGLEPDGSISTTPQKEISVAEVNSGQVTGLTLREASRTRSFWFLTGISLLNAFCYNMLIIHIVPHATDIKVPEMQAATIISVLGASNIAGRLLIGRASDAIGRREVAMGCALLLFASILFLVWAGHLYMLYIFAMVFGFCIGGVDTTMTALTGDIFGMRYIGSIIGATQTAFGIGMILGPLFGGFIFDRMGNYSLAFGTGAMTMLVITALIAMVRRKNISFDHQSPGGHL
ncbi:MAG: MFS transporter [Syntrophorhabdus sp.]